LEGTLKAKIEEDVVCNFAELKKKTRRTYGLGYDVTFIDLMGVEYPCEENVFRYRKNLWLERTRQGRGPKNGKFIKLNIVIEVDEVEILVNAKIFSFWNTEAMNLYLNLITSLKNRSFSIMINGIMWNDRMSIGSKKPLNVRAIPDQANVVHGMKSIVELGDLNVHSIMLKCGELILNLTAPRNVTLGQAIVMWSLLGIQIPPFSYLQIDGRKLTDFEYKVEPLDH
jgi:hypothetical protein